MNKILKNTLILTAITLIAGLGLGLVHEITLNPIAQAQEKAKKEAWQAVFPDAKLDEFKETDVDQKAAKQQSVILVLMQLLTKSVQLVIQDMSLQQPIRTDMAEIFRLVLVSSLMVL